MPGPMTLKFFLVYFRCFLKVLSNLIWQGPVANIWPENNFKPFCTLAFLLWQKNVVFLSS